MENKRKEIESRETRNIKINIRCYMFKRYLLYPHTIIIYLFFLKISYKYEARIIKGLLCPKIYCHAIFFIMT